MLYVSCFCSQLHLWYSSSYYRYFIVLFHIVFTLKKIHFGFNSQAFKYYQNEWNSSKRSAISFEIISFDCKLEFLRMWQIMIPFEIWISRPVLFISLSVFRLNFYFDVIDTKIVQQLQLLECDDSIICYVTKNRSRCVLFDEIIIIKWALAIIVVCTNNVHDECEWTGNFSAMRKSGSGKREQRTLCDNIGNLIPMAFACYALKTPEIIAIIYMLARLSSTIYQTMIFMIYFQLLCVRLEFLLRRLCITYCNLYYTRYGKLLFIWHLTVHSRDEIKST